MRDPEAHDAEVAWTSHLPHILAYAFAHSLERAPDSAAELAASGFADFTRIAQSDAALWGDILAANSKAIAGPLQTFVEALRELASAIERGDTDSQENFLAFAREQLSRIRPVATAATSDRDRAPSYQRWDARVNWNSVDEQWMVGAFVNNITDETGIRQIDRTNEDENFRRSGAVTFPRQAGLELRWQFGS